MFLLCFCRVVTAQNIFFFFKDASWHLWSGGGGGGGESMGETVIGFFFNNGFM